MPQPVDSDSLQVSEGVFVNGKPVVVGSPRESWPQFGYDDDLSGYAPNNTVPTGDVEEEYLAETDADYAPSFASAEVVDETVYFAGYDGHLYAFDAETGDRLWKFEVDSTEESWYGCVVKDGVVYHTADENVYAVDADDGSEEWSFTVEGSTYNSSTLVTDDGVYVGDQAGKFWKIDRDDGSEVWDQDVTVGNVPIAYDGSIYAWDSTAIYQFDPDDGSQLDSADYSVVDGWVRDGSVVYCQDSNSFAAVAIDLSDWSTLWTYDLNTWSNKPAYDEDTVYFPESGGNYDGCLHAVDKDDGSQQWVFERDEVARDMAPTVSDSYVTFGTDDRGSDPNVFLLDKETGDVEWSFNNNGNMNGEISFADGAAYVPTGNLDGSAGVRKLVEV